MNRQQTAKHSNRTPLRVLVRSQLGQALNIGESYPVESDQAHHAFRVRRLDTANDAELVAWTGNGQAWLAKLVGDAKRAELVVMTEMNAQHDSAAAHAQINIHVVQALPEADKMDWILEKCTELGVSSFSPVAAARSVVKLQADRLEKRHQQWLQRLEASCNQCGLNVLPELAKVASLDDMLDNVAVSSAGAPAGSTLKIWLDPFAEASLHERLDAALQACNVRNGGGISDKGDISDIWIAIGPEGGWTDEETRLACQSGWMPTRLHHLVLRTETAALVAVAQLQALLWY